MTNQELREFNKKRKIRQICVVTKDLEKSMDNWIKYLGIGPWRVIAFTEKTIANYKFHGEYVTEPFKFLLALADVGDIEFELIQPVYGPNVYQKFLEEKGEGLHHFKEKISDEEFENVLDAYKKKGIEVNQSGLFGLSFHAYLNTEPFVHFIYELGNCPEANVLQSEVVVNIYPKE